MQAGERRRTELFVFAFGLVILIFLRHVLMQAAVMTESYANREPLL
jgi:hypothetical protein